MLGGTDGVLSRRSLLLLLLLLMLLMGGGHVINGVQFGQVAERRVSVLVGGLFVFVGARRRWFSRQRRGGGHSGQPAAQGTVLLVVSGQGHRRVGRERGRGRGREPSVVCVERHLFKVAH
jgi:hypothetical protein